MSKFFQAIVFAGAGIYFAAGESFGFAAGCFLAASVLWYRSVKNDTHLLTAREREDIAELEFHNELLGKASEDFKFISNSFEKISDRELRAQISEMQTLAGKILNYLRDHPARIPAASKFINYYQDKTASFIRQYISFSEIGMNDDRISELTGKMKDTFRGFAAAYEVEFEKVIDSDITEMDAEMEVARQVLNNEGIEVKSSKNIPAMIKMEEEIKKQPETQIKKNREWKFGKAGAALIAIGLFGLYKLLNHDNDKL